SLFRSLRASSCTVDCSQAKGEYVCGTDGVTYASRCELQRAKQCDNKRADGSRVKVRSKGRCPGGSHVLPGARATPCHVLEESLARAASRERAQDTDVVSKCFQEREEARKAARRDSSDVLIPSCNSDGTYSEVQCHTATRYCWCVTKDGRHIPGTSVQERRPRCKAAELRAVSYVTLVASLRKACGSKERQSFNAELVKVFREEYERMLTASGPQPGGEYDSTPTQLQKDAAPSDDDVSIEKKIVIWKFSQLDTNADGVLSFKEIRSFRRMVKKLIKPRRCAKRFHKYCDKDSDRRIQKTEWTLCLGVDIKQCTVRKRQRQLCSLEAAYEIASDCVRNLYATYGIATDSACSLHVAIACHTAAPFPPALRPPSDLPPLSSRPVSAHSNRKNRTDSNNRNCQDERQAALLHAREEPTANIYIPRCQPSGLWTQAQCHEATQYCWCVSEQDGVPIAGTSTYKVEPNCTIRDHRQMKGCPFEQKRRFIVDLMADLTQEMTANNQSAQAQGPGSDTTSTRERVARWKLETLDKNNNG
ncbi:hypothetical protein BaRGS_00003242, partial [Batillaria attramentaria]